MIQKLDSVEDDYSCRDENDSGDKIHESDSGNKILNSDNRKEDKIPENINEDDCNELLMLSDNENQVFRNYIA